MSHSHIPVRHLIKQVEVYRNQRRPRDVRPAWMTQLIERIADLFDPCADYGRVGFDCQLADDGWLLTIYLGCTEVVGGKDDGSIRPANFHFDLAGLLPLFDQVDELTWTACPHSAPDPGASSRSMLTLVGEIDDTPVRVSVHSLPPADLTPALKQYADGAVDSI